MKNFLRSSVVLASLASLLASCHSMGYHKECGAGCNSQKAQSKVEDIKKTDLPPQEKKVKKARKAKRVQAAKPAATSTPSTIVKETKSN